jgi:chemotaxis response regulator CheB
VRRLGQGIESESGQGFSIWAADSEWQMKQIRVLVANQPRLMRELMVATIAEQPDIEIVGEVEDESKLAGEVERTRPDFLIVALEEFNEMPKVCHSILQRHPQMKVIAVSSERNSSMFYWASLKVQSNEIEASEAGVLGALRGRPQQISRWQQ